MIFAVSVALAMLEWTKTSYLSPNAANRWPVNSACSRPGSGNTNGWCVRHGQGRTMGKQTETVFAVRVVLLYMYAEHYQRQNTH